MGRREKRESGKDRLQNCMWEVRSRKKKRCKHGLETMIFCSAGFLFQKGDDASCGKCPPKREFPENMSAQMDLGVLRNMISGRVFGGERGEALLPAVSQVKRARSVSSNRGV